MATKHNDGGPAYPFQERNGDGSHYHSHAGMSLRDWFAGKAVAGICANSVEFDNAMQIARGKNAHPADVLAKLAYDLADAMIAARQK